MVAIAFDSHNRPLPKSDIEYPVDLTVRPDLKIQSFRGEDLSHVYEGGPIGDAPAREEIATAFEAAYP